MTRPTKWHLAGALLAVVVIATLPSTVAFRRWLLDFLPLIVLLACPLLHVAMHPKHQGVHGPPRPRAPRATSTSGSGREHAGSIGWRGGSIPQRSVARSLLSGQEGARSSVPEDGLSHHPPI